MPIESIPKKTAMEWKRIPGFQYSVSNDGLILNTMTGKLIKHVLSHGYYLVGICLNKKRHFFPRHRLVALLFVPNPENKPFVNHKNCIKTDNRAENLEWCTHKENIQHAYDNGLCENVKRWTKKMGMLNKGKPVLKRCRQVINNETGELFQSATKASAGTGFSRVYFTEMMNGRKPNKTPFSYFTTT